MQDGPDPAPAGPAATAGALVICPLLRRRGLLLAGEADTNSRRALHDALAGMPAGGPSPYDFHLELAGLRFIDVSCTREIILAAEGHPAARLILHHPPFSLRRIAALLWPEGAAWTGGGPISPAASGASRHMGLPTPLAERRRTASPRGAGNEAAFATPSPPTRAGWVAGRPRSAAVASLFALPGT